MKIQYIKGDLLATPYHLIVHGCNAKGRMGSGVAKLIKQKFPQAYQSYYNQFVKSGLELGQVIFVEDQGKIIANGITQENYGRDGQLYIDYQAINNVIKTVDDYACEQNISHIAMPLLGAGLGGGDWNIISNIIEQQCQNTIPVVYTLDGKIPK